MPALVRGFAEEEMKCVHPRSAPCGWALYFALPVAWTPCLSGKGGEALGRWKTKDYWSQVCTYTALLADHYWCMPLTTTAPLVDQ